MGIGAKIREEMEDFIKGTPRPNRTTKIISQYNVTYKELSEFLKIKEEITDIKIDEANKKITITTQK
jgi:hypothetical protein